ncbi:gamma secretase complex protein [Gaertneriomyces sp. JEL0708]|nr:gamma secretase complex protein [Gaertneriomyces sp. JEL0708]
MTLSSFFGNAFMAYGPALSVFLLCVAENAQMVILFMTSAFFWLISILVSSIIWYIIKPMQTVPAATIFVGVLLQECGRYLSFRLMSKAERGLNIVAKKPNSPLNRPRHAFVLGLGMGLMSGLTSYLPQLAESAGPAVLPCSSCPGADVFFISAITTFLFIFLHTAWNMVAFEGWYRRQWLPFVLVVVSHYAASFGTLFTPSTINSGCIISIAICVVNLVIFSGLAMQPLFHLKVS